MSHNDLISNLYSYTKDEQDSFPYIRRYMEKMLLVRNEILRTSSGRERFMLAGLFLTYRAFNHNGFEMTTQFPERNQRDLHYLRLSTFKSITGKEINNTSEYLAMLKLNRIKLMLLPTDMLLVNFVTRK